MIRIATFNVENLFERAKVLNLAKWSDGGGCSSSSRR
jgi:hypothetical protein